MSAIRNKTMLIILLSVFMIGFTANAAFADSYTITDLGTLGGTESFAYAINDRSQIVGSSRLPGDTVTHAFLYSNSEMTDLSPLNSGNIQTVGPTSINNSGQIASGVIVGGIYYPAILDSKTGGIKTLGSLGGVTSYGFNGVATSINNHGQAVGYSYLDSLNRHAFIYSNEVMTDLGSYGGYSGALAVNNSGVAVGFASDLVNGVARATMWSKGNIIDLTGGGESYASDINDRGQVVGQYLTADGKAFHGFLYNQSTLLDLGSLGGPDLMPYAINERGQIVGTAVVQTGTDLIFNFDTGKWIEVPVYSNHAFIYDNGVMTDLNNLIQSEMGWNLSWAFDINNSGQIVGYGLVDDKYRAYLLTKHAVPEPATILLLGFGLIGLAGFRRKLKQ